MSLGKKDEDNFYYNWRKNKEKGKKNVEEKSSKN